MHMKPSNVATLAGSMIVKHIHYLIGVSTNAATQRKAIVGDAKSLIIV